MNSIIISTSFTLTLSFMLLNHPLSFGLILLMQTITIALITGMMSFNYWFSYIIFLIMIGGMLILFIYMTSVASNEKFKMNLKIVIPLMILSISLLLMMLIINNWMPTYMMNMNELMNQMNSFNFKFSLNKFFNYPFNNIFFLMIIYLLLTLIMVVKITNIQYGPLRQKL